jgi:putative protease
MKTSNPPFPELLAPAGSVEAYFAAVSAGADAVYLGLQKFSARERAENFTLEELCRILPHARQRGVRVYLAMNTLLTEADLPEAIALLHQAAPLLPDAVIVQDLGLMRIVREFFPGIPLHVSTQAGCASAAAAGEFARLGAQRVILERHLMLEEVRQIAARSRVGVEIFVHGAMCYSYSGKCFFSSYLGGKSANRGACVQPCRRLYGHEGGEEAVFSTRDLSRSSFRWGSPRSRSRDGCEARSTSPEWYPPTGPRWTSSAPESPRRASPREGRSCPK